MASTITNGTTKRTRLPIGTPPDCTKEVFPNGSYCKDI